MAEAHSSLECIIFLIELNPAYGFRPQTGRRVSYALGWRFDRDLYGLTGSECDFDSDYHAAFILPESPVAAGLSYFKPKLFLPGHSLADGKATAKLVHGMTSRHSGYYAADFLRRLRHVKRYSFPERPFCQDIATDEVPPVTSSRGCRDFQDFLLPVKALQRVVCVNQKNLGVFFRGNLEKFVSNHYRGQSQGGVGPKNGSHSIRKPSLFGRRHRRNLNCGFVAFVSQGLNRIDYILYA
jgi:hypothetical protein